MHPISENLLNDMFTHGYLLIFTLVFLQEVGFPNPIPNEIVLLLSGYLVYLGKLHFFYAIGSAVIGDLLGSSILFTVFYFFGNKILTKKPSWIPVSEKKISSLRNMLHAKGYTGIFLGRLSPFIRGYVSVLSGLMNFDKGKFSTIALSTAFLWASSYVVVGYAVGPFWSQLSEHLNSYVFYFGLIPLSILGLYAIYLLLKPFLLVTPEKDINNLKL